MAETNLDELTEYPAIAVHRIGDDQRIVSLLTDNPNVEIGSDEAESVYDKYIYDYMYVDRTTTEAHAYICIESEIIKVPTPTMKRITLYVTVLCHKDFMILDSDRFPGLIGNRRDNICRCIDSLIGDSDLFGVGGLSLVSVRTISAPENFTARELTYKVPDFKYRGAKL